MNRTRLIFVGITLAALALAAQPLLMKRVTAATFVVTTVADNGNNLSPTPGSLRAAIIAANGAAGLDTIEFSIGAQGSVQTIIPVAPLPTVTDAVIIDGWSQGGAGYTGPPLIELNGSSAGASDGLIINSGGSTVRGLVINRFSRTGLVLQLAGGNTVQGNYIGTNVAGDMALGNGANGIIISTSSNNNIIGGATASARNIVSGNGNFGVIIDVSSNNNNVQGNYIGTNAAGTAALANAEGVVISNGSQMNVIGGVNAGEGNLISGNTREGVHIISATNNRIEGNRIGTDAAGTMAVPNLTGVFVTDDNNTVGGTAAGAGNLIAFNTGRGVFVFDTDGTGNAILSNMIFSNGLIGIDLRGGVQDPNQVTANDPQDPDVGPNNLQNYPVITAAGPTVQGSLNSTPNTMFRLEFFSSSAPDPSGFGEGEVFRGFTTVTTDAMGNAAFDLTFATTVPAGQWITATATDPQGNTSEFSAAFQATADILNCLGITCPSNITVSNDPNQCGAVVNYPAPMTSGNCGTITCSPASGSFFPVGTTTVTCNTTAGASCSFTVTVNDTQPPSIDCPDNVIAVTTAPGQTGAVVTFPPPAASDNCPGVTTACTPPSGSTFPVGTTTVTCTATDASGNTASCSFAVQIFDVCLQDEARPVNVLLFNSFTGDYIFCCGNVTLSGRGTVTKQAGNISLQHNAPDRRVMGKISVPSRSGNGSLQFPAGTTICTISDFDIRNNTCACGPPL